MSCLRGADAEALAAGYLRKLGVCILARNFRCRLGEIDLIGLDGEILCFIEVRHRARTRYGTPIETVSAQKRHRIIRTAEHFLLTAWRGPRCPCRFDVVAVEGVARPELARITRLPSAFELEARF
jgi:putative endonuclease